jgi:hypothetical protein
MLASLPIKPVGWWEEDSGRGEPEPPALMLPIHLICQRGFLGKDQNNPPPGLAHDKRPDFPGVPPPLDGS